MNQREPSRTRRLGDVATVVAGGTPSRSVASFWGGSIPWVTTTDVNFNVIERATQFITEDGLRNSSAKIFPTGTLLLAMYGQGQTRGRVARLGIDAATNQACAAIIPKEGTDPEFLYQFLSWQYERIRNLGHGGNQKNLNASLIRALHLPRLDGVAQRRLGETLKGWDDALTHVDRIILACEKQRRSLLTHLVEGSLRFTASRNSRWAIYRLSELLDQARRPAIVEPQATYPLVSVRRRSGGIFYRGMFAGSDVGTKDLRQLRRDDFLISRRQIVHGASAVVTSEFAGMYVSGSYAVFAPRKDRLSVQFLRYLSETPKFYYLTYLASHGVHIEKLLFDTRRFLRSEVRIPADVAEQARIADVLAACDTRISLYRRQRELLVTEKAGMTQLLFGRYTSEDMQGNEL